jgi:predicted ATPase
MATLALLIDALGLSDSDRAVLIAAATGETITSREVNAAWAPLPVPLTSLLGRAHVLAELNELLRKSDKRLVTLTGPGGIGKTHLALVVASGQREAFADGVAFVDLAPVHNPELVPGTIVRALGLQEASGFTAKDLLLEHLKHRHALLLIDNFEHLLQAGPFLAELLAACPLLTALTTSRAALRIRGEHTYAVPPLSVPGPDDPSETWAQSGAVALFVSRACDVKSDFRLTEENLPTVVEVCRGLDGLPLAIELAAARLRTLPVSELHKQLADRLSLASRGPRDLPPRQQALRATLDWSIGLLTPEQELLFQRLGVFVGGCSLEAVQAVCGDVSRSLLESIDLLEVLVDHNLIRQVGLTEDTARFSMLETIRQYAAERLSRSSAFGVTRQLHASYFLSVAESAAPRLQGPEQSRWLDRLEVERANLRAAFRAFEGSPAEEERMVAALWRFWVSHGHLSEGREFAERALEDVGDRQLEPALRVSVLNAAAVLTREQGDFAAAEQYFQESLLLSRAAADLPDIAFALNGLGVAAWAQGDYAKSREWYEESLQLRRELGDDFGVAMCLNNLGTLESDCGDFDAAWARHEESLQIRRAIGEQRGIAQSLQNLGEVALRRGDTRHAGELYRESLVFFRELGERMWVTRNLDALARVAEATGDHNKAVRLLAAAAAVRQSTRARLQLTDSSWYEATVGELKAQLGEVAFAASWSEGLRLSLSAAIEEALQTSVLQTAT